MTVQGQRAARRRQGGVWVEVDENGDVPQASETVEDEDDAAEEAEEAEEAAEESAEEEGAEEESADEEEEDADLNKMSRAELDTYARERGLDPSAYKNRELLLEALEA